MRVSNRSPFDPFPENQLLYRVRGRVQATPILIQISPDKTREKGTNDVREVLTRPLLLRNYCAVSH